MNGNAKEAHDRQQAYVASSDAAGDLVDGRLFVESMRKHGYRNPARAADELIDNSIEAGAENIHIYFGYATSKDTKPDAIAFVDDGYGMIPGMITAACRWGGTDRHNSRRMFGRFGFGLPSASVSQGRRFAVYSRIGDEDFYRVTIDVDEISAGTYSATDGRVITPTAVVDTLPAWVVDEIERSFPGGVAAARTVVIWDKLDFRMWRTKTDLERNLLQRFGVTYRGYLRTTSIKVNDKTVEPIDPLFTTPGARFYENPPDGAEALPGLRIPVKDEESGESLGDIVVRYSYLPPQFLDGARGRKGENWAKARFSIRKENNGLIFTRHGRQIDVVSRTELYHFQNNDRYVGVQIDFPATMDDLFGVTNSKQAVEMSERVVQLLRKHNVQQSLGYQRERYRRAAKALKNAGFTGEDEDSSRTSEKIMENVSNILQKRPRSEEQEQEATENLQKEIERAAQKAGVPPEVIASQKQQETIEKPYKVEFQEIPEGPFYRPELRGSQLVIILNTAHQFFTEIYATLSGFEGNRVRVGLELLLFVLGQSETEAMKERRDWYQSERGDWSSKLTTVLARLENHIGDLDEKDDVDTTTGAAAA
ncbi:ATP-binding protein [Krasilnikovia sp. M28-CT-15]|uniref:ATP-binding protein n=1 Tax=Krasilnikovia sp. M28-CT-15 TaxID=3373540 RepID=UPI003875CD9F